MIELPPGTHPFFRRIVLLNAELMDLAEQQNKVIASKVAIIAEQQKVVDNLITENARLQPKRERLLPVTRAHFGRNPSWKRSAWLGLRNGVLFAPTDLVSDIKTPLAGFIVMAGALVGCFAIWALARPALLICGLCGFVVEKKEVPTK